MAINKNNSKNKKTATNNQWAGANSAGSGKDYKDKTATDNEWISTNKVVEMED